MINKKSKFYSLDKILETNSQYNIIIGERSNGKTYAALKKSLYDYCKYGYELAIIRRWGEDFKGKRGQQMFAALVSDGLVEEFTGGEWTGISYYASKWYLNRRDEETEKIIKSDEPFAYGFSLASMEHDKSTSFPKVRNIVFDEFLSRQKYLPDEFVLFMNVLSTIIRQRDDVKIFMLGNTVTKYCPYFAEMGLKHVKEMKQGTIDVYQYGESGLQVAVEYCVANKQGKKSDIYFAFDNPKLNMITGGAWEMEIYPHLPMKYKPKNILFTYFILFDTELLQCEIILIDDILFTYIHRKTSELKERDTDIIFSPTTTHKQNWYRNIARPMNKICKEILRFYVSDRVFYQDNEIGEIVRNYFIWCGAEGYVK